MSLFIHLTIIELLFMVFNFCGKMYLDKLIKANWGCSENLTIETSGGDVRRNT